MGNILTVYSRELYQEYALPRLEEGICEFALSAAAFGLRENLRLKLEVRNGKPAFLPADTFSLRPVQGKRRFPLPLETGSVYFLTPGEGGRLVLMLKEAETNPVPRFFRLDDGTRFSIGAFPENQAVYSGGGTVSGFHAALVRSGGVCRLEDRSCNGVYVNGRRAENGRLLESGDRIHICGLTVTYLGDRIALDTSVPGLRIQAEPASLEYDAEMLTERRSGGSPEQTGEEDETVFERQADFEDETVFEGQGGFEDETVLESQAGFGGETVLESQAGFEGETVFESQAGAEDETVFERPAREEG